MPQTIKERVKAIQATYVKAAENVASWHAWSR